jgi:hypothetical protein
LAPLALSAKGIEARLDTDDGDDQQGIEATFPANCLRRLEDRDQRFRRHPIAPRNEIQNALQAQRQHFGRGLDGFRFGCFGWRSRTRHGWLLSVVASHCRRPRA